jgi:hypothetical protein
MAAGTQPLQVIERPCRAASARRDDVINLRAGFIATLSAEQVALQHDRAQRPPSGGIVNAKRIVPAGTVILLRSHIAHMVRAIAEIWTPELAAGPKW